MAEGKITCWWDSESGCYDLEVCDPSTTVADYEQAVEEAMGTPETVRKYNDHCLSCGLCCGGRLPLTVVDLYRLKAGGMGKALALPDWVKTYGEVRQIGDCYDIMLRLDEAETCALWDRRKGCCSAYQSRPLICRTYVCAPLSWRAAEVRLQIVNAGEDELVCILGMAPSDDANWERQPFAGVLNYSKVMLKNVCSSRLWHSLYKEGPAGH